MKVYCKHCKRFLFETVGTTLIQGLICPNSKCKARLNIKVITNDSSEADKLLQIDKIEIPPKKS